MTTDPDPQVSIASQQPTPEGNATPGDGLAEAEKANHLLLERLRAALLASEPAIDPAMVTGDTADKIEASFAAARDLVRRLRDAVQSEAAAAVPAGAPGRTPPQPGSAFAKIRAGLEGR